MMRTYIAMIQSSLLNHCHAALLLLMSMFPLSGYVAYAAPVDAFDRAMQLSASGQVDQAVATLRGATDALAVTDIWHTRLQAAIALLQLRQHRESKLQPAANAYLLLAQQHIQQHPRPTHQQSHWTVTVFAAALPGAGHAWMGRWHDARTAAIMVWPMLLLCFWAWRRSMGPVTVFFALITLWLWSGTVFSAVSLAERGMLDDDLLWWQQVWLAAALPGHTPW